ncbi:hypothetical protein B0H63DRAFT_132301 [Podospora didyma]|uniref:J domain-containing protein n=1 Tax=Podospora didyma TaxID=330526 RepID=A0AAE0U597_9PEZI|nr:hypothetical protein B0H63DRAFT_132301 [Podospora didyma]
MLKLDYSRDYYADLDLPPTADVVEVKKQFKKLAFKWHPDRNRGREDEVKDKFVSIQSAHEILTDPTAKAKFDEYRRRNNSSNTSSRFPTASGFRGNPYQDVSKNMADQFGAPPQRRTPMPTRPTPTTNTSSRYSTWGQAPTAKAKTDNATDNLRAWDRMRTGPTNKASQASSATSANTSRTYTKKTEPPLPPRTAAQAKRAEAAFGTRRTGFAPSSPAGDEPPVKNSHYSTTSHSSVFEDTAARARKTQPGPAYVDPLSENFGESRQSTPYASHLGERTNPFEGTSVNRAKSVRESWQRFRQTDGEPAAPPPPTRQRSASVEPDSFRKSTNEKSGFEEASASPRFGFARGAPGFKNASDSNSAPPSATFGSVGGSSSNLNGSANATGNGTATSEGKNGPNVFSVPDDDDDEPFPPTPPAQKQARFMRNSTDNINTRFVADESVGGGYKFNAGGEAGEEAFLRAKQRSRSTPRGRQSPLKNGPRSSAESVNSSPQQDEAAKKTSAFDPNEWTEQIGAHFFVPPASAAAKPSSPTRNVRPSKKPRPVRMTAGTAGIMDEDDTSGEERSRPAPAAAADISGARSPNAMDIDTPVPTPPELANPQPTGARTINVEPSKPEWRAGDVNGVPTDPKLGSGMNIPNVNPNGAGSEDTEDFMRPLFPEFRTVDPFVPKPSGLNSFSDLSSTLPFESKPSAKIRLEKPKVPHLSFPHPPVAPTPPPGLLIGTGSRKPNPQWLEYVRLFGEYLAKWPVFNKNITDHFYKRQQMLEGLKRDGYDWLNTMGDAGMDKYLMWLEQDKHIRQKWMVACDTHELKVREFKRFRDMMKQ